MLIALQTFGGQRPRIDARHLSPIEAQTARNCKLWEGTLLPWYRPTVAEVTVNPGPTSSIYRFSDGGYWLHWNRDVDAVRGPIAGTQRLYWTGDGVPKFGNVEIIGGVSTLTSGATAAQNFILVNNARGFKAGDSITITLNVGSHSTVVTTVQASLNRINLQIAIPSAANVGNGVVNNNHGYPHGSYSLGVPAPTVKLAAAATAGANKGTVVSVLDALGEQTGASTTANDSYFIDLVALDGQGELLDFEVDVDLTGPIVSTQSQQIKITVVRDPGSANDQIFENVSTPTFQGPAASTSPGVAVDPGSLEWQLGGFGFGTNGFQNAPDTVGGDGASSNKLHFQYTPANGPHTYRLKIENGFVLAFGTQWTYTLRISARRGKELGIKLNTVAHGLKEGDRVQFGAIVGTGTLNDVNKAPVDVLRVVGDTVYVDTPATGDYTSGGTWQQVWDETELESRSYVYTYVASLDGIEMEGAPSPPSDIVDIGDNQSVSLTGFINPTALADERPYSLLRIYRTSTANDGNAEFLFVGEVAINTALYIDTVRGTALGEVIPSTLWEPPPADLVGLVELPNGGLAGFRLGTNEVCLCQPYQPHSWPIAYRHSMLDTVVNIAAFGTSIFVGTKGRPTVLNGTDPSTMSEQHIEVVHPCLSKRGTVDMGYGVLYPTLTGLCYVAQGQASLVTEAIFTEDQWKALNPSSFIAAKYGSRYVCFYDTGTERAGFILDPREATSTLTFLDFYATDVWSDPRTDRLYFVRVNSAGVEEIVEWNADKTANPMPYRWLSKRFVIAEPSAARVLKVDAKTYPVLVNLFADGELYDSVSVPSATAVRVSDKKGKSRRWEIEVIADVAVEAVYLASNMRRLQHYTGG